MTPFNTICRYTILFTLLVSLSNLHAVLTDLLISDPDTVYIQWQQSASDPMIDMDGDDTIVFTPYNGGPGALLQHSPPQDFYIGVMCNSLAGYDITLTASGIGVTSTTARLDTGGGSPLTYSVTLTKESGTFAAGATASTSLNLTGATASATVVFAGNSDLPLSATAPNVWKLTATLPTIMSVSQGMVKSGSYSGSITSTIALK